MTAEIKESTIYTLAERRITELHRAFAALRELDSSKVDVLYQAFYEELGKLAAMRRIGDIDKPKFLEFHVEGGYYLLSCPDHEYCKLMLVPTYLPLRVGYLDSFRTSSRYFCFHVNRFTQWITPIPQDVENQLDFPDAFDVKVDAHGTVVTFSPRDALAAFNSYKEYLGVKISKTQWEIKPRYRWQFLCRLVMDGVQPFTAQPVDLTDLRDKPLQTKFVLFPEQAPWHEALMRNGRVGNFGPMGAGKMFWGVYELCQFKPPLFIAAMPSILEQWKVRIQRSVIEAEQLLSEIDFISLQQAEKFLKLKKKWVLGIGDEFHRSPAPTHSPMLLLDTKYFIAETATPYREGPRGKEEMALLMVMAHHPLELNWSEILKKRIQVPSIDIWIVKDWERKLQLVKQLANKGDEHVPTILFTWERDLGDELARRFAPKTEPITGVTPVKERIPLVEQYLSEAPFIAVVSTVGSEGWDLPNLRLVIEVGFHKGSRVEEIQRIGRLMHAKYRGEYHVVYTNDEWIRFGWKRTMAAEEKGLFITQHFEEPELQKLSRFVKPQLRRRLYARPSTERSITQAEGGGTTTKNADEIPQALEARLPYIGKTIRTLRNTIQKKVAVVILANPGRPYTIHDLAVATGLTPRNISANARITELVSKRLIKTAGSGQYVAAQ